MTMLIKGMEMPPSDKALIMAYKDGRFIWIDLESEKTYQYEAVEVPTPHGRLIDADAVKKPIAATYYSQDEKDKAPRDDIPWMNGCNTKVKEVCWMIDDAPTVIEAEEG